MVFQKNLLLQLFELELKWEILVPEPDHALFQCDHNVQAHVLAPQRSP